MSGIILIIVLIALSYLVSINYGFIEGLLDASKKLRNQIAKTLDETTIRHRESFIVRVVVLMVGMIALIYFIKLPYWFHLFFAIHLAFLFGIMMDLGYNKGAGERWNYIGDSKWDNVFNTGTQKFFFMVSGLIVTGAMYLSLLKYYLYE